MLPHPVVPRYNKLDTRLSWKATSSLQLALTGSNLLHAHHLEYELAGATTGDAVDRNVFVEAKWRF